MPGFIFTNVCSSMFPGFFPKSHVVLCTWSLFIFMLEKEKELIKEYQCLGMFNNSRDIVVQMMQLCFGDSNSCLFQYIIDIYGCMYVCFCLVLSEANLGLLLSLNESVCSSF